MTPPEFTATLNRVVMRAGVDLDPEADMTVGQRLQLISAVKSWLNDLVQEIESEVEAQAEAEQNRAAEQP